MMKVKIVLQLIFILFGLNLFSQSINNANSSLIDLCDQYPTDKCPNLHNYISIYEKEFAPVKNQVKKVFEIGILSGASHRMWKAYFKNAAIYGIDIEDCSHLEKEGIHTFLADQSNRQNLHSFIEKYGSGFDIIIDDGGHTMDQQQISLGYLFPYLKSGGIYIIEDVHTSLLKYYQGFGAEENGTNTTFNMLTRFISTNEIVSVYMQQEEMDYLKLNIASCELAYIANGLHSIMCIIRKKP